MLRTKIPLATTNRKTEIKPKDFAVDGVIHYTSFFLEENLDKINSSLKKHFKNWSIIGIAFSGDINDEYNHLVTTFIISDNEIKDIETKEFLTKKII